MLSRVCDSLMICVLLFGMYIVSSKRTCRCDYSKHPLNSLTIHCTFPDYEEIKTCIFTHPETEQLILRNNSLTAVPDSLALLKQLTYLDLSYNLISRVDFSNIDSICNCVKTLILDFNKIRRLFKGDLDCFTSLESIAMANNTLFDIEFGVFNNKLGNLNYVHLIHNELRSLDASMVFLPAMKHGGRVNGSWNFVSEFTNFSNITVLNFTIDMSAGFSLIHNNISRIGIDYYFKLFNVTKPLELLRLWNFEIDIRFNPLICDCEMYPLANKLREFRYMDPNNPVFGMTCFKPASLRGMLVYQVPEYQFNCSVKQECPKDCLCTKTIALNLVTIYCDDKYQSSELPNTIPASKEIHLSIKSDRLKELANRAYLKNITELDVSQCEISQVDVDILDQLENITTVYLQDNSLQVLPKQIQNLEFDKLKTLTLHGNPFKCDCDTLWFKKWLLRNQNNVPFQNKILCGSGKAKGKILIDVSDSDFVCETTSSWTINDIIIASISGLLCIIVIILTFICSRSRLKLILIEYVNSSWCRKKIRSNHEFDIFISHSSLDDAFIHEYLIPKLHSHTPPYKVFIDERHFIPGKTIVYNINNAIERSHTTLMILSNDFLQSNWCLMEFREAHLRLLRDRDINLVVVVKNELKNELIDEELKTYMNTHVFLKSDDKHFWSKLLQVLPIRIAQSEKSHTEHTPILRC